jgi:hypothetical protein
VGRAGEPGDPVKFKTLSQFDSAVALQTGQTTMVFRGEHADGATLEVRGDDPLPFNVLGIAIEEATEGR